jgi:hypothetical protein
MSSRSRGNVVACPRCRQPAPNSALREGRCENCGAALVSALVLREATVRFYMRAHRPLYGRGSSGSSHRKRSISRWTSASVIGERK